MKQLLLATLWLLSSIGLFAAEEEVALEAAWGTLRGTLWLPSTPGDTALVMIAGSGPTDRYGNSKAGIQTQAYALLAQEISEAGYALLSYDKRGIAASYYNNPETILSDCRFAYYVDDAERWVEELHRRGYAHIYLIGHSEGAKIALQVAARNPKVEGVISLCGPGFPIDEILKVQLAAQLLAVDYTLYAQACRIIDTLKRGETPDPEQIPASLQGLFPPYLNTFYHEDMACDPCQVARKLTCPLLIVSGGRDLQVSAANGEALKKAYPSAEVVLFERMAHTLKESEGSSVQTQMEAYTNPSLPLAAGLVERILEFLHKPQVRRPKRASFDL